MSIPSLHLYVQGPVPTHTHSPAPTQSSNSQPWDSSVLGGCLRGTTETQEVCRRGKNTKTLYFILVLPAQLKGLCCTGKKKWGNTAVEKPRTRSSAPGFTAKVTDGIAPLGHVCGESLDRACSPRQLGKRNRAEAWV